MLLDNLKFMLMKIIKKYLFLNLIMIILLLMIEKITFLTLKSVIFQLYKKILY